jgi:hypothetical protein
MRRFATCLVLLAPLLPAAAAATTAPSLTQRIAIDGRLDEYAHDEWVLDATTPLSETGGDSRWGADSEITRVALTWDREFLYVAVELAVRDARVAVFIANRAGGLPTLENAGDFRRAITLLDPVNLVALAGGSRPPQVARSDAAHPFGLVDRAALPAAIAVSLDGRGGFEMAVPWSMLSPGRPVRLVAAITGETGEGAGDAAPDPSASLDPDPHARSVLDRVLTFVADADGDGAADAGVAPRADVVVTPHTESTLPRGGAKLAVEVSPRVFAPDRAEAAALSFPAQDVDEIYLTCEVFSIDGSRVRTLFTDAPRARVGGSLAPDPRDRWDGTDDRGEVVRGGTYVLVAGWGLARGERSARATAAVAVVR